MHTGFQVSSCTPIRAGMPDSLQFKQEWHIKQQKKHAGYTHLSASMNTSPTKEPENIRATIRKRNAFFLKKVFPNVNFLV
jgi:hypothetical protein